MPQLSLVSVEGTECFVGTEQAGLVERLDAADAGGVHGDGKAEVARDARVKAVYLGEAADG